MAPAYHGAFEGQGPAASGAAQEKSMSLWQPESLVVAAEMENDWSHRPEGSTQYHDQPVALNAIY